MDFVFLLIGVVLGVVIGYFLGQRSKTEQITVGNDGDWEEKWRQLDKEKSILDDRIQKSLEVFQSQKSELEKEREKSSSLQAEISKWKADFRNLEEKLNSHQLEMEQMQKKFTTEFENIATKILKQNTTEFAASNSKNIGEILNPLKEKLSSFEKKVDDTHREELRDKASLKQQVKDLMDMNKKLSDEASNLTAALKGDNKQQGNWGELVLERVLERSGLIKGEEYFTQENIKNEEGLNQRPDVIIRLPDEKHIIIDAKVSLVHYEAYANSENDEASGIALKNHLQSVRNHVRDLSDKGYQTSNDVQSPDFVLLFFPIEPSFLLAIKEDHDLFNFAWDKRIVLVSPTTLLATLRTIASVWKQERQNKNVREIARQGGALYEKFVLLLQDLEGIEKHIGKAKEAYDSSVNKLTTGKGNLLGRVEKLRKLGVKTDKQIPERFALEDENQLEE